MNTYNLHKGFEPKEDGHVNVKGGFLPFFLNRKNQASLGWVPVKAQLLNP